MTRDTVVRILILAGGAGLAALFFLGRVGETPEVPRPAEPRRPAAAKAALPAVDLGLHYEPGGARTVAVAVLTLMSREARNAAMEQDLARTRAFYRTRSSARGGAALRIGRNEWIRRISFSVAGDADAARRLNNAFALQAAPESENLVFRNSESYDILIEIPAEAKPPAGSLLSAQLTLEGGTLVSNTAAVPSVSEGPEDETVREGRLLLLLRDGPGLQARAEALIAAAPERLDGHWFLGEAFEMLGRSDEALEAFREAIRRAPALSRNNDEGPFHVMFRLQELSQKASAKTP